MAKGWATWSLFLLVSAFAHRSFEYTEPLGFLVHTKDRGVVFAQASAPIAPSKRERASVYLLAMGRQISINDGTIEQLETVPHIGPSRAAAIVKNRRKNGSFSSIGDLRRVHGIGPRTIQRVAPYLIY
jgi:competence ComEA-like helix-hairpin-helix protein